MMKSLTRSTRMLLLRLGVLALAVGALITMQTGRVDAANTDITAADTYFCSPAYTSGVCVTNIAVGDSVTWHYSGLYHTSTECGGMSCDDAPPPTPVFDSGVRTNGQTYAYTFNTAGTYLYQCGIHGSLMRGQIVVGGAVGGQTELGGVEFTPLDRANAGSRPSSWAVPLLVLGAAIGAGVIGAAGWYAGRRRLS